MGTEVKLLKTEERKTRAEAGSFLRLLADKVESGQVLLRAGETEVQLEIPASVILELQVEQEDKRGKGLQHSLEVTLKWYEGDEGGGPLELG